MDLKKTALGIELGSTRIKAVLIDENHIPVASGDYEWENQLVNGIWTYSMEAVHTGLRACFAALKADLKEEFGVELTTVGAIGVSAMMHGYLPFDKDGKQLAEFRTWRNTIDGTLRFQHSAALEHRPPVSGNAERRRACERHRLSHNPCGIYPLEAYRGKSHGHR